MNNNRDKGIFLETFYNVEEIPELIDKEGKATKFAKAAEFWGETAPKTEVEVKTLVKKGKFLIETNAENNLESLSTSSQINKNSLYGGRQSLSVLNNNRIKVPFVKTGAWKHDSYGEVKFTNEDLDQLVNNYKAGTIGFTPYLTLGHLDEEPQSTDSFRKRGDLEDILIEEDNEDNSKIGYGIFKVNDDIYRSIQKGEYEYSSGEFNRRLKTKETGDEVGTAVMRVALTNSPFLPFGNKKIQALSADIESCPETKENYVFLLSVNAPLKAEIKEQLALNDPRELKSDLQNIDKEIFSKQKNINNINNSIMEQEKIAPPTENKVETTEDKTLVKEDLMQAEESSSEVNKVETSNNTNNISEAIVNSLTSKLDKVEQLYKSQLDTANAIIKDLVAKVDVLSTKLESQSTITQAFSSSMSQAQEQALVNHLQNSNVQPALVRQFLSFKEGLGDNNIVKLSVGVGEEAKTIEQNVVEAVADLLINASNQSPLVEKQLGISSGRKPGTYNFESIIERNRAAASKTKV